MMDARSEKNLIAVHPRLVAVVRRGAELCQARHGFTPTVIEGVRSQARQLEMFAQGRTKPGPIVTWLKVSNHMVHPDNGFGHAVDMAHVAGGQVLWSDGDKIAECMFAAAHELGAGIRWGADWDRDGKPHERGEIDSPHFELAK